MEQLETLGDLDPAVYVDDDMKKAKEILQQLIRADDRIHTDPEPVVVVSNLGESSVDITTRVWVDAANYFPVLWDLTENAKAAFDEAGISIPYPQRDVHIRRGEMAIG